MLRATSCTAISDWKLAASVLLTFLGSWHIRSHQAARETPQGLPPTRPLSAVTSSTERCPSNSPCSCSSRPHET
ncbi:hypothetical protein LEMLEM_LOCUS17230 [Lemmus lemmus]